jgi:hypothetical protein
MTTVPQILSAWKKSTYSGEGQTNCVEFAPTHSGAVVRDTKARAAGHLAIPEASWKAFLNLL